MKKAYSARTTVTIAEKIGYGIGDTASNIIFQTLVMFSAFYYTDIVGISATIVGVLFLSVRVFDAVFDVGMGIVADRTRSRWGQFRPWILWLSMPLGISAVLAFSVPSWPPVATLAFSFVSYALLMILYSAVNIPYGAMATSLTADPQQRTSIQSWRFALAMVGTLIVSGLTLPLVDLLGGGNRRLGYSYTMAIFAAMAVALLLICFCLTRERLAPRHPPHAGEIWNDLRALWGNDQWRLLAVINFVSLFGFVMRGTVTIYFVSYVLHRPDAVTSYMTIGTIGAILGSLMAGRITGGLSPRGIQFLLIVYGTAMASAAAFGLVTFANVISSASALIFCSLLMDWAGRGHDRTRVFGISFAAQVIAHVLLYKSASLGFSFSLAAFMSIMILHHVSVTFLWSMMSDSVDYGEWKTGTRLTGLHFSGCLFALKLGVAFGGACAAWQLDLFGYAPNVTQSASALQGITITFAAIPGVVCALLALLSLRLRLSLAAVTALQSDLGLAEPA